MADTVTPGRIEPTFQGAASSPADELRAAVETSSAPQPPPTESPATSAARTAIDQLARIEDKSARIEEKYARTEAILLRVEDKLDHAVSRIGDAARQPELSAMRQELAGVSRQVRSLPGVPFVLAAVLVTALLSAALTVGALKYDLLGMILR